VIVTFIIDGLSLFYITVFLWSNKKKSIYLKFFAETKSWVNDGE